MTRAFKLIIFGDAAVGKTTLVKRCITGFFSDTILMTLGMEIHTKELILDDTPVVLQVWDLAGEKNFRLLLPNYGVGAHGGIFIYDITSPPSLAHLGDWMSIVRENAPDLPVIVAGAKKDLEDESKVTIDEAKSQGADFDIAAFFEVSSKTGENVEDLFEAITRLMLDSYKI